MHFNSLEYKKIDVPALSQVRQSKCFFQRCVPQAERDVHFVRDVSFGCEVCLRHVLRNTSHHCERSEQYHYAMHNITLA